MLSDDKTRFSDKKLSSHRKLYGDKALSYYLVIKIFLVTKVLDVCANHLSERSKKVSIDRNMKKRGFQTADLATYLFKPLTGPPSIFIIAVREIMFCYIFIAVLVIIFCYIFIAVLVIMFCYIFIAVREIIFCYIFFAVPVIMFCYILLHIYSSLWR